MGSTQTCTIAGVLNFNCVLSWFDTAGFRATVTRCIAMYISTHHAKLWCHLEGSGDMSALCDIIEQRVYKGLRNDIWGRSYLSCRSHRCADLVVLAPFVSFWTLDVSTYCVGVLRHVWAPGILFELLHLMATVKATCVLVIFSSSGLPCNRRRITYAVRRHSSVSSQ